MHILIASPHFNEWRGNKITAERIRQGLEKKHTKVSVVSSTEQEEKIPDGVDVVHGFHAYKFAVFTKKYNLKKPYIITLTGTDINQNIKEKDKQETILNCLRNAVIIHAFDNNMKNKVLKYLPEAADKIKVLPQSVQLNKQPFRSHEEPYTFLLPAGIRTVKNIIGAIEMTKDLSEKYKLELIIAGPVIEAEEADKIFFLIKKYEWLHYAGEVPFSEMGELYHQADIVLNTSLSEGQSSAVLEAMAAGRPVLASDIEGNKGTIKHGYSGLLYSGKHDFFKQAELLIKDKHLKEKLAENAYQQVKSENDPEKEITTLLHWYIEALERTDF